eukprot:1275431-Rhodomonas_salina.1
MAPKRLSSSEISIVASSMSAYSKAGAPPLSPLDFPLCLPTRSAVKRASKELKSSSGTPSRHMDEAMMTQASYQKIDVMTATNAEMMMRV